MFKRLFHFILFFIVFIAMSAKQNELSAQSVDYIKVSNTLNDLAKKDKFSGVVLIAENGKVKFEKAYGNLDNEKHIPNQTNTIFELASVSKQFTAMTIMMLNEKGLLKYDDLVEQYINIPYKSNNSISNNIQNNNNFKNQSLWLKI